MALVPIDPNNGLYIFDNDAIAPRYPLYNSEEIINQLHANWPSHNLTESNNLVFDIPGIAVQHVDAIFCTNERHMLFAPQFLRVNENGNGYDWVNNLSDQCIFQCLPVKNVNAHGCQIAPGLCRLFLKILDPAVLIRNDDTKPTGLLHGNRHHRNGNLRPVGLVEVQHHLIVHLVDMVS